MPPHLTHHTLPLLPRNVDPVGPPQDPNGLVLEAWAQGYMVGSLVIMAAITIANMRRGVLLHKLILLELVLGMFHGTFIFTHPPVYGWYLSTTAIFLNMSWSLHNVISWMKTKPFLSRRWSLVYIGTVALAQPYWVVEIYANFTYFNGINDVFLTTRPYEALFRDPWWIFSTLNLFYNIQHCYRLPIPTIISLSPRFAVLLAAMLLSICFIILDIISVTHVLESVLPDGLNPFWKLAFVFKCLVDSIVLDDFKTALDRLMKYKLQRERVGQVNETLGATVGTDDYTSVGSHAILTSPNAVTGYTASQARTQSDMSQEDPLSPDAGFERTTSGSKAAVSCRALGRHCPARGHLKLIQRQYKRRTRSAQTEAAVAIESGVCIINSWSDLLIDHEISNRLTA